VNKLAYKKLKEIYKLSLIKNIFKGKKIKKNDDEFIIYYCYRIYFLSWVEKKKFSLIIGLLKIIIIQYF